MKVEAFDFDLDESLIAQHPIANRQESRLMVLDRVSGKITHGRFSDITTYLEPGDALIVNDSRVLPARLYGHRHGKDELIEVLLLKKNGEKCWECLVKPGRKMKVGTQVVFDDALSAKVVAIDEEGLRTLAFDYDGIFEAHLDRLGEMPLPPYIKERLEDKERYQTVYAKELGSSAAPTAGLHFTESLLQQIADKGVRIGYLTLHVGLGTFRPVKVDDVLEHKMHSEFYTVPEETAALIADTKAKGGRVFAVGTTSTRTLESVARDAGKVVAKSGWTDIFIYPGYRFQVIDGLITNFHLPKSTLMMLVSAFAGRDYIMDAYRCATKECYRFFSFGDAMIITEETT